MSTNRNIYDDYDNPGCLKTFLRAAIVIGCLFWLFRFGFSTFGSPPPLPSPTPTRAPVVTAAPSKTRTGVVASFSQSPSKQVAYIGNARSKKFHKPSCSSVKQMYDSNKVNLYSRQEAIDKGYDPCGRCRP